MSPEGQDFMTHHEGPNRDPIEEADVLASEAFPEPDPGLLRAIEEARLNEAAAELAVREQEKREAA